MTGEPCGGESVGFKERRLVGESALPLLDGFERQPAKIVGNSCAILRRTGPRSDRQKTEQYKAPYAAGRRRDGEYRADKIEIPRGIDDNDASIPRQQRLRLHV